jgi:hypothetical protein
VRETGHPAAVPAHWVKSVVFTQYRRNPQSEFLCRHIHVPGTKLPGIKI